MYTVNFIFETDKNYFFNYIPCDMIYDGSDEYRLSKSFLNKDEAIDYAVKTADFFFSHIMASSNFNRSGIEEIKKKLKTFQEEALANRNFNTNSIYIASQCIDEEVEFTIKEEKSILNLNIPINTDKYSLFLANKERLVNSIDEFVKNKLEEYEREKNQK